MFQLGGLFSSSEGQLKPGPASSLSPAHVAGSTSPGPGRACGAAQTLAGAGSPTPAAARRGGRSQAAAAAAQASSLPARAPLEQKARSRHDAFLVLCTVHREQLHDLLLQGGALPALAGRWTSGQLARGEARQQGSEEAAVQERLLAPPGGKLAGTLSCMFHVLCNPQEIKGSQRVYFFLKV